MPTRVSSAPLVPTARLALLLFAMAGLGGSALAQDSGRPAYPTTEAAEGARTASVSVGEITATISLERVAAIDPLDPIPVLRIIAGAGKVAEVPGAPSGFGLLAAEASIAEIDPTNAMPEVYFHSYSGGAHCCVHVIVVTEVDGRWTPVTIGDFDGDANLLDDPNGDGLAEIVTIDNRFLYAFDCYACSAAPLVMWTVRSGVAHDISDDPSFRDAHRDWLAVLEETVEPERRWTSAGFLAGWVAAKARIGEGREAFEAVVQRWNLAADPGEEACLIDVATVDDCPPASRRMMKFPERLKLFLERNGYPI